MCRFLHKDLALVETARGAVREAESVCGPVTDPETALVAVLRVSANGDWALSAQETEAVTQVEAAVPVTEQVDRAWRDRATGTVIQVAVLVPAQVDRGLQAQEGELVAAVLVPAQVNLALQGQRSEAIGPAVVPGSGQGDRGLLDLETVPVRPSRGVQGFPEQDPITAKTAGIPVRGKRSIQALGSQVPANQEMPATPITRVFRLAADHPSRSAFPTSRDKIQVINRTSPTWIVSAGSTSREAAAIPEAATAWPFP